MHKIILRLKYNKKNDEILIFGRNKYYQWSSDVFSALQKNYN